MAKTANHVEIAERIVQFFKTNKGVGNTASILDGARKTQANVLVVTEGDKGFKGVKATKQISFDEVLAGQLEGNLVAGWPLVVDNAAVVELLSGLLGENLRLGRALKEAKKPKKEAAAE